MPKVLPWWYWFVRNLVRYTFFQLTGGLRAEGLQNIPKEGPVIVAPNHVSYLDPPAVACGITRMLRFMAKEELFRGIFGRLISSLGSFPVKRGEGDTDAMRKAFTALEEGCAVIVFPEGTRGDGVRMLPINKGVALMAKRTGALILPVGVTGTHVIKPKGASGWRRKRITVRFGTPFHYSDILPDSPERDRREAFAGKLESEICSLCAQDGYPLLHSIKE